MVLKPSLVHPEILPKKNAWTSALLNLQLCDVMWASFRLLVFCSRFPRATILWPSIMKLPFFLLGDLLFIPLLTPACSLCPASVTSFASPGVQKQFGERNEPPLYEWLKTSVVRQLKLLAMQGNRSGVMAKWWPLWGLFLRWVLFFGKNMSGV